MSCNTTSDHLCIRIAGTFDSYTNTNSIDSFLSFLDYPVLALIGVFFKHHELANPKNTLSILVVYSYLHVRVPVDALKHQNVLTPFILLDLTFSAALDTVNLPSDLANARRTNRGLSKSTVPLTKE